MRWAEGQWGGRRIPFLLGVLGGRVGIYTPTHFGDPTAPRATKQDSPIKQVFLRQKLRVMLGIGALALSTAVNYLLVYMPTYVVKTLNLPPILWYTARSAAAALVSFLSSRSPRCISTR